MPGASNDISTGSSALRASSPPTVWACWSRVSHHRPAIGIAYNPPFYPDFLSRLGFAKETDFVSGYLPGSYEIPERVIHLAEKVKERYGFRIAAFKNKRELRAVVPEIIAAYNQTFVDNWEYVAITPEEGQVIADRLLSIITPDLVKLVYKGDEIAGFVLCYPDISAAIQRTGGRLFPFGWYHLLREFKRTEWVNANGVGIVEKYRGRGVDAMMFVELAKAIKAAGYKHCDLVQIDEANAKMQAELAAFGVQFYKRHRIFRRTVAAVSAEDSNATVL